jgi:chlorite dismutase
MVAGREMREASAGSEGRGPPVRGDAPREFLKYTFYRARPEWRALPRATRSGHRAAFASLLREFAEETGLRTYSLVGIRGDVDFMTWAIAHDLETFASNARRIASADLGGHLEVPYSYLAMRRRSMYLGGHEHAAQDGAGAPRAPVGSRYLFVYPFTKKREWYSLPFEERQRMMRDHFRIGHRYPGVTIHTGYSFGLDDHEFVLAFEADRPQDFSDLVLELRSTEASRYTASETPIFTCLAVDPAGLMAALGD